MNMKSKIALVTGASSGIGQATAELLAKAGYKVYGTSRRGGGASGRSFEMLPLDVTSDESVDTAVQTLMQTESRIAYSLTTPASGSPLPVPKRVRSNKLRPFSIPTSSASSA